MRVRTYYTVAYENLEELEKEVTSMLNDGWELAGNLIDSPELYIQPMMKVEHKVEDVK